MNYIKEMNAFYDYMEKNSLSSSAIALWFALMHINNKTRWKETFTVAGTVLRYKSGLKETSFKRARKELVDKGYIIYEAGEPGRAPSYQMVSFIELWEEKQVSTYHDSEPVHYYETYFGNLKKEQREEMVQLTKRYGEKHVMEALGQAFKQNIKRWDDVKLMINQRKGAGFITMNESKPPYLQNIRNPGFYKRTEIIPDWFEEMKKGVMQTVNIPINSEQWEKEYQSLENMKNEVIELVNNRKIVKTYS